MTLDPHDPQDRAYKPKLELVEVEPVTPASPVEEFVDRLYDLTPRAYVTTALIVANVLVFLAMAAMGVSVTQPTAAELQQWGANFGLRTTNGEWWRLLTATFLHVGMIHLAFNVLALYQVGGILERLLGNWGFAFVYVASGLCASLTSLCWDPFVTSAGASGAVFGAFGALLGCHVRARRVIPPELFRGMLSGLLPFLGYNLLYGLIAKNIDQSAHLGGLVAGFVLGLALGQPRTLFDRQVRTWRTVVTAAVVAPVLLVWILAMRGWVTDPVPEEQHRVAIAQSVLGRYRKSLDAHRAGKITDEELAIVIEKEIVPPWRESLVRLETLRRIPPFDRRRFASIAQDMRVRIGYWELLADAFREQDAAKRDDKIKRANALLQKRDADDARAAEQRPR